MTAWPDPAGMYFHDPSRRASRPEWWTEWLRPLGESPSRAGRTSKLSGAEPSRSVAGQRREAGQQVDLVHQRVGQAGPDPAGPADQERDPRAPLEQAILAPAERPGWTVAVEVAHRPVGVTVVHHGAVIAGEQDERPVRKLEPVEDGACASANRRPSRASRSMFGVRTGVAP